MSYCGQMNREMSRGALKPDAGARTKSVLSAAGNQSALRLSASEAPPVQRVLVGPFPFTSDQENAVKLEQLGKRDLEFSIWLDMACELMKQKKIDELLPGTGAVDTEAFLGKLYSIREFGQNYAFHSGQLTPDAYDSVTLATHGQDGDVHCDVREGIEALEPAKTVLDNLQDAYGGRLDQRSFHPAFCDMACVPDIRAHYGGMMERLPPEGQAGSTIAARHRTEFIPGSRNKYARRESQVVDESYEFQLLFRKGGALKNVGEVLQALQGDETFGSQCLHLIAFLDKPGVPENFIPALEETGAVLGEIEERMALKVYETLAADGWAHDRVAINLPSAWEPAQAAPGQAAPAQAAPAQAAPAQAAPGRPKCLLL